MSVALLCTHASGPRSAGSLVPRNRGPHAGCSEVVPRPWRKFISVGTPLIRCVAPRMRPAASWEIALIIRLMGQQMKTTKCGLSGPPRPLVPFKRVKGPGGGFLMLSDLPPANTTRWVIRRKAEVVVAIHGGLLSVEEACTRYGLTAEELLTWDRAFKRFGVRGLRATQPQRSVPPDQGLISNDPTNSLSNRKQP